MSDATARFCAICSATYDQAPFRFCPVDGTPLMAVPPREALARAPLPEPLPRADVPVATVSSPVTPTRKARLGARPVQAQAPEAPTPIVTEPPPPSAAVVAPAVVVAAEGHDAPTRIERVVEVRAAREKPPQAAPQEVAPASPRFSETNWFNRPPSETEIDPETGRVLVDTNVYRRSRTEQSDKA